MQNMQLYLLGGGLGQLHEVALTLVFIIHSERMSHSEPGKPLHFPQGERKEERAKDRERSEDGREKGVTKCVPNEKRRQDEKDHSCPGSTLLTLKGPFWGSCTSVLFQPNSSLLTNSTHWHWAGPATAGSFSTWPKHFNLANLKWIHPCLKPLC